jgi:GGDEF domain-containing protein
MNLPKSQMRLLSPHELLQKIDEDISQSRGSIGVVSMQIVDIGYFARKFGLVAVEELTREFAKRLILTISESGYFCRRPDSTFVVVLNAVATTAALEMKINQIANEVSFLATVSDLDFRIECVTGACDPSMVEEALSAVERADSSLKRAIARQVSYHIDGLGIDGLPLRYSMARRRGRQYERRGGDRRPVHTRAKCFLDHLNASVECIVLDVSRGGARLRIADSLALPDEFDLLLSYGGERQRVRLRWRRQKDIGVEFIEPRGTATA